MKGEEKEKGKVEEEEEEGVELITPFSSVSSDLWVLGINGVECHFISSQPPQEHIKHCPVILLVQILV